MPQFMPFRGLRYTPAAGPLDDLLAPPYDVITPAMQRALGSRNPRNAVHLELAEGGDERYERAAALLRDWRAHGLVEQDSVPMLYVYEQEFVEEGHLHRRRGIIAAVEALPWESGVVKPHEFTMSGPKEDRLKLLQATGVQLSPVFCVARDRAGQLREFTARVIGEQAPTGTATSFEGDHHRFWAVESGPYEMRQLAPLLAESFYIADGHHRYETAVNYRNWRLQQGNLPPTHPARFVMAAIVPADDPGLVIRPIHRLVPRAAPANWLDRLGSAFDVERVKLAGDAAERRAALHALLATADAVALELAPRQVHALRRKPGASLAGKVPTGHSEAWLAIGPNVLRYGVLEPLWGISDEDLRAGVIEYSHDLDEVFAFLEARPGEATAFLLNPVRIDDVMRLADLGERMPQKSTYFHPKLGTGLVFYPLEP
jgi:uncharacterized protein (DUF1015 family)